MKFNVNQKELQEALSYCQGVIEKRSTLQILSNVLLNASNSKLTITATDLDLIFIHQIENVEILEEGNTTTTSSIMFDIVRKFSSDKKLKLSMNSENKLQLESEKSIFNLNCINSSEFPLTDENFDDNTFIINSKHFLKLLHKCKFSISNDETWKRFFGDRGDNSFLPEYYPPLNAFVLKIFLNTFGYYIENARILTLIFGSGSLILVFYLTKIFTNIQNSLIATCLTSLNLFLIWQSSEIRPHSFVVFFSLLNIILFLRLFDQKFLFKS